MMRTMFAVAGAALALTGCAAYPDQYGGYGHDGHGYSGYGYPARSSASVYMGGYSYGRSPYYGYGYGSSPYYGYAPSYGYGRSYSYAPGNGYAPYQRPYYVVPGHRHAPTDTERAFRQERREDRQEFRQERREDRREFRQDRREAREAGLPVPPIREAYREERRADRREFRQERREDRREFRGDGGRSDAERAARRQLRQMGRGGLGQQP